jgi:hypothetical protein
MHIIRLKPYLRAMAAMGLADADMRAVERSIELHPDAHPIIKGLKGVRKARFARPGMGKSGGGRAVYYFAISAETMIMLTACPKNERDDLSTDQRRLILAAIEQFKE